MSIILFLEEVQRKEMILKKRRNKHLIKLKNQAKKWSSVIQEEIHFVKLIKFIIDVEVSNTILQQNIETESTTLFTKDHHINVRHQAALAYHALYCGSLDEVKIKQIGNFSLSGHLVRLPEETTLT